VDLFKDYFTRETLAKTLVKAPFVPGRLGETGLFATRGLNATTAIIEELPANDVAPDSAAIARGAPASSLGLDTRKAHTFTTASYGWTASVLADEVLNVRAAGSGAAEVISSRVAEMTAKLRRKADLQHEALRMACLKAPSNSIGNAPASAAVAVQTDATKLRQELFNKIQKPIESALGGIPYTGVRVFCSDGYWAALIENKWIKDTYLNTSAAATLRQSGLTEEVAVAGVVFERDRGAGTIALAADTAIAVPEGVGELFLQCFAPDDTLDSVGLGAMGAPYFLRSEVIPGNKGWKLVLQSHPLMVCTRPEAVLTIALT
jgi:hypothetical protein